MEERTRTGALFGAVAQPGERPDYPRIIRGAVAQPGERFNGIEEVEGSSPSSSTNFSLRVATSAPRLTAEPSSFIPDLPVTIEAHRYDEASEYGSDGGQA